MPKGKKGVNVTQIFEQFTASLHQIIKEKVTDAVQAATKDFFASKFNIGKTEAPVQVKKAKAAVKKSKTRRGRPKGSKNKAEKAAAQAPAAENTPAQ